MFASGVPVSGDETEIGRELAEGGRTLGKVARNGKRPLEFRSTGVNWIGASFARFQISSPKQTLSATSLGLYVSRKHHAVMRLRQIRQVRTGRLANGTSANLFALDRRDRVNQWNVCLFEKTTSLCLSECFTLQASVKGPAF